MVRGQERRHGSSMSSNNSSPDGPLHGVDQVAPLVCVRDDAAAGFILDVEVAPLAPGELIEQVLPGAIRGDRHRVAEQHRAGIGGQVRLSD